MVEVTSDVLNLENSTSQLEASRDFGCLPFTWENWSVHGLGKWWAKLRTSKFRPGIAFTICTNQFHLLENDREHKFPLGIFRLESSTTFSAVPLLPEIFR